MFAKWANRTIVLLLAAVVTKPECRDSDWKMTGPTNL